MSEQHEERLPAVLALEAFLPPLVEDGAGGGALDRADRARRRVTGPFQRPQHAIDRLLVAAIEEAHSDLRGRVSAVEGRMDWAELEVARLAGQMADREARYEKRVAAVEAALALIAARLDGRAGPEGGTGKGA